MRALILLLALAAAAPAAAQDISGLNQLQFDALRAEQSAAQLRAINEVNERMALESRLRAQQAILDLQLQRALPAQVPVLPYASATPPGPLDVSKLPQIPDAALAESNKRVRDAVKNPR